MNSSPKVRCILSLLEAGGMQGTLIYKPTFSKVTKGPEPIHNVAEEGEHRELLPAVIASLVKQLVAPLVWCAKLFVANISDASQEV